jgi:hypothetical protein
MRAQIVFWRIGGMLALCALAGCFEQLPEADACNTSADCLLRERCAANRCIPEILIDRDQAEDMLMRPDLDAPDLEADLDTPDRADAPEISDADMSAPADMAQNNFREIELQVVDESAAPGTPVSFSNIAICISGSTSYLHKITYQSQQKTTVLLREDEAYDIYVGKTQGATYYQIHKAENIQGDSLAPVTEFAIKPCSPRPGEGSCEQPPPCYVSAFPGPHYVE